MVHFPVRKCYFIAKVSLLIILVVAILGLFEKWRGGKRSASALTALEEKYEKQILEDEAKIIPGLGEGGVAAYLSGDDKKKGEESEKKLAMNVYLSDRIAYNRTLQDHRNPSCARLVYDAELPSASVILIFHNEPYSVVLRTIWSVINSCKRDQPWFSQANHVDRDGRTMKLGYPGQDPNSPLIYLKEIILVDDNSTLPELKGKLSHYVRTRLPPDLIRILRLPDRQGLITARIRGARSARGDVLIFLDAHCEVETDWMRPLLQRVRDKRDSVITPIIDVLDQSTFQLDASEVFQVGGFTFTGHFTWIDVSEKEKKRRGSDISPTWSPTMAGGLFAINRAYYWELGAYDEQMAGWGGENLEMSFRIWQCGGTLETVPCSRVGHVFRSFHPYSMPANSDTHGINTARMAEVWMDEYAELFYLHRPDLRANAKIGDVTHRKVLREKLKCKNFQWYLDNIYREKFVPVRDSYGYGRIQNPSTGFCLDSLQRDEAEAPLGVYPCHADLQGTQYYSLSYAHELRGEEACAQLQYKRHASEEDDITGRKVLMSTCYGKQREQKWKYIPATQQIQHTETQLCLDAGAEGGGDVLAKPCSDAKTQQWIIDYTEENDFQLSNSIEPTDQEMRLRRLRGQRRKSRSLLSFDDTQRRHHHKKHHKRTKKNKTKNKFILKLVRTLMNNTDEHLEVDIHCKHKQLYPNNTFVRDLVTILNDRNIKVINNGRVFERNKVTQLDPKTDTMKKVLNKMDITTRERADDEIMKKTRTRKRKPSSPESIPIINAQEPPKSPQQPVHGYEQLAYGTGERSGNEQMNEGMNERMNGVNASGFASTSRSHRIIIEDFIEMTTAAAVRSKKMKRRKRKRISTPVSAPAMEEYKNILSVIAERPNVNVEEQINVPPRSEEESMEDFPMASEGETVVTRSHASERDNNNNGDRTSKRDKHAKIANSIERDGKNTKSYEDARLHREQRKLERKRDRELAMMINDAREKETPSDNDTNEVWALGESRFRANEFDRRRHRLEPNPASVEQSDGEKPSDDKTVEDAGAVTPAPVKVVMRSNLTFNLGEEFFKWRAKNRESDADSALSIPSARSPSPQAWLRGDDVTHVPASGPEVDDDVIATGRLPSEDMRDTDESGTSDSASE